MENILGIDLGSVRIGLAITDALGWMAHPFKTIPRSASSVSQIAHLLEEKSITTVVLGLPLKMDGSDGLAAQQCRDFARELEEQTRATIILWDERLTTATAARYLHEAGRSNKEQKAMIDQVAAQQILQDWLDAQRSKKEFASL